MRWHSGFVEWESTCPYWPKYQCYDAAKCESDAGNRLLAALWNEGIELLDRKLSNGLDLL